MALSRNVIIITVNLLTKTGPFLVPMRKIVEKAYEEDFYLRQEIGRGGFGVCTIVQLPNTNKFYVAKVIKKTKCDSSEDMKFIFNEIQLQANLKHKNIVSLEKVYVGKDNFTLITEFCFYGSLSELIGKKREVLGETERRHIIHGILSGAKYLHNKCIVHGDIKPLNIFISKELVAKLGDFGMAHYEEEEECFGGTLNYFAPEMFRTDEERHTAKTDLWAAGCTAYFTYTGVNLFPQATNDRTRQVRRTISRNKRDEGWSRLPYEVRSFIYLMTQPEPAARPDAGRLLRHPFLMRRAKRLVSNAVLQNMADCIINPYEQSPP